MMTLSRWSPARDLLNLTDEMNRLVTSAFGDETRETSLFKGAWTPLVDISEDDNNFYLRAELPGLSKENVNVKYEEGMLTIAGEKPAPQADKGINYHRVERRYGMFERSFRITSNIVADKVEADFADGVLTITLPKAEEIKPKAIEVKIRNK
jgi:HSP20 family protein